MKFRVSGGEFVRAVLDGDGTATTDANGITTIVPGKWLAFSRDSLVVDEYHLARHVATREVLASRRKPVRALGRRRLSSGRRRARRASAASRSRDGPGSSSDDDPPHDLEPGDGRFGVVLEAAA